MYVNVMPFINGIKTTINYRSTEPFSNLHFEKLYQVLDACIHVYNHASHTVTEICCDQKYSKIMDTAKDELGMHRNYSNSGD